MTQITQFFFAMLLLWSLPSFAQVSVSGHVCDSQGEPLPGATVAVSNGAGTITDGDGYFCFVADSAALATCSFVGYEARKVIVSTMKSGDTIFLKEDPQMMGQVVVTGTRTPRALMDAPIQTRLISSIDISRADATNVEDLMQQELPGVEFTYAKSQQVNMNLSGFAGQGVLFLIDGERLAGENVDNIDFSRLDMSNVKQIEIVKGAASALYGSQANGGVINIITKDEERPWTLDINHRMAAHNEQRTGAKLGLHKNRISNALNFARTSINNYGVDNGDNPKAMVFSTVYGCNTISLNDKLGVMINDRLKLTARAGYFRRETERTPGAPERFYDFSGGLRAKYAGDSQDLELSYSFDEYDKSDYQSISGLNVRDYSNVQNILRGLYNHYFGADYVLTAGADFMHDYLMNYYFADGAHEQDVVDAFAQLDWHLSKKLELIGALRYDYFGEGNLSRVTPKLSLRWQPILNLNVRGGYGMGFRAPTLKELFTDFDIQGIWFLRGNSALEAEDSHNFNLSLDYTKSHYNLNAMGYFNKVRNRIATSSPAYDAQGIRYIQYINLDGLAVLGGELAVQWRWDCGLSAKFSYVFTHEDKETASMSQYTPPRPHSFTSRVDWAHDFSRKYNLSLSLSGRFLSSVLNEEYIDILDESKGTQVCSCPAYTIWKLSVNQRFCKRFYVNLAVDNLFNYKPEYYYSNAPITTGANFMIGVGVELGN